MVLRHSNPDHHGIAHLTHTNDPSWPGSQGPGTKIQSPVVSRIQRPEPSVHDQGRQNAVACHSPMPNPNQTQNVEHRMQAGERGWET